MKHDNATTTRTTDTVTTKAPLAVKTSVRAGIAGNFAKRPYSGNNSYSAPSA